MGNGRLDVGMQAAIGKGIRRYIDDGHDRPALGKIEAAAMRYTPNCAFNHGHATLYPLDGNPRSCDSADRVWLCPKGAANTTLRKKE